MTEDDARAEIARRHGDTATERIGSFLDMVIEENERQNLISPGTIGAIWARHALDGVQLKGFDRGGIWLDIGTGGGFPGVVIALLRDDPVLLVEPRRLRAEFLERAVERLGLFHVTVFQQKVEKVTTSAAVISARAVASTDKVLRMARHCATATTRWLLPRGQQGKTEFAELRRHWAGTFHVEHSLTDPESTLLVLEDMHPR